MSITYLTVIVKNYSHFVVLLFSYGSLTVHDSLSAVMHAPFHASMLRPASLAGPVHESAGVGEVS